MLGLETPKNSYSVNQSWVLLVPGLEMLSQYYRASHCLFGICGPLRNFRKVCSMDSGCHLYRLNSERGLGQAHKLGGMGPQGFTKLR